MSYSESNGQVILTMSKEDCRSLMLRLGSVHGGLERGSHRGWENCKCELAGCIRDLCDVLNSGNPHYTPYQVEAKK